MLEDNAIQIARPEADRVPAGQLVGIALVCASAGMALAYGLSSPGASDVWTPPPGASSSEAPYETGVEDDFSAAQEVESGAEAAPPGRVVGSANAGDRAMSGGAAPSPSKPQSEGPRDWTLMGARAEAPVDVSVRSGTSESAAGPHDVFDASERTLGRGGKRVRGKHGKWIIVPAQDSQDPPVGALAIHARTVMQEPLEKPLALRKLQRGAVTYLRCDGARRNKRSNQCPRDRRLEAGIWKALKDLPKCRVADPGMGGAQLKLTVKKRSEPLIEVAAPEAGSGLNLRAVNKCMSPDLVKLRPRIRANQAVITFAFGLH